MTRGRNIPHRATGNIHELKVAEYVIEESGGEAYFSETPSQCRQRNMRLRDVNRYANHPKTREIERKARISASILPVAKGEVCFTESDINPGEVYDFMYVSIDGERVKVSCKFVEMEDKAYRFCTNNYRFFSVDRLNEDIFGDYAGRRSYNDVLTGSGMSVPDYQEMVIGAMISTFKDEQSDDFDTLKRLTVERFIGSGGYYKTLNDGGVRYYPEMDKERGVSIKEIQKISHNKFSYLCLFKSLDGETHEYRITFRVKFKDGKNKKVAFTREGAMRNIAATVTIDLLC